MNSEEIQALTKRIAANPNFIRETEEEAVQDILLHYSASLLDPNLEQEVRELIVSDPVVAAMWKNFNEIDARLRSPEGQQWSEEAGERILSNVLSEKPNIAKRFGEAVERAVEQVAFGIKRLLSEFRSESFVAAHLGDEVATAETDVVRVISLVDCPGLRQRLPWLGATLRVYQQERSPDQSTAKYIACVETLEVEPNRQNGELRVILAANSGKRGEVLLSFDFQSCEFPISLPADECQLTLECYADNVA
jgi:hypothetical protein